MIAFPNAKINLGLRITGKRADGYHNLETLFYPVSLHDALEIIQDPEEQSGVRFSSTGIALDIPAENNLCVKAWQLIRRDYPDLPAVQMHLHKKIPAGAGLGGGSSDASFTLRLLNEKFRLHIPDPQLAAYALELGSDCPFFLLNKPSIGRGRGELLTPVQPDLSAWSILLINPGIHISTAWAFSQIECSASDEALEDIISRPVHQWKNLLKNDFEKPVFARYPELAALKLKLYEQGAGYVTLSGTGSSMIALFSSTPTLPLQNLPSHYGFTIL